MQPGPPLAQQQLNLFMCCSGMLPGFVAGYYTMDESHIDLGRLAAFAGARLIHSCVQSLNLKVRPCPLCPILGAGDESLGICGILSMCRRSPFQGAG